MFEQTFCRAQTNSLRWSWVTVLIGFVAALSFVKSIEAKVLVFAPASTTTAVSEITEIYKERGLGATRAAFTASSLLARQIAAGAPADIFISANPQWMDFLEINNAIAAESRVDIVANQLVLIAPSGSNIQLRIESGFALVEALGKGRLAIGDPNHVPAGIYAEAALINLGVWSALDGHLALTQDVRAALALVERGEADAGIVYASDAAVTSKVLIVDYFPAASHPPITYPAAIVTGRDRPEVRRFFTFLRSTEATKVFVRHGFIPLKAPEAANQR